LWVMLLLVLLFSVLFFGFSMWRRYYKRREHLAAKNADGLSQWLQTKGWEHL
jgi:preprotein translocase subunit YajC